MPAISHAHILIVDDEPDIRGLLRDVLEDEGYRVSDAPDAEAARLLVAQQAPDAVLLDIWMPGEDGLSLLRGWAEAGRRRGGLAFPVVMMSGHGTVDTAVEATKLGAYDFIEKPITLAKLLITLQRALEASRLRADNAALRRQAQPVRPAGDSTPMQALREKLERLAGHDSAVLLRGEPGTEKEALARWLHSLGPRRDQPFIAVVPGAIASGQAAATLFGAEDASGVRPGLLEQAQGGTLFLDEVAELDAELQQRLSSVIERGQLLRVGGQQPVDLNVRVVAATAQDLEAARAQGDSATSCISSSTWCRWRCRRCASVVPISPNCWPSTPRISPGAMACRLDVSARPRKAACSATIGRATCASCATWCSA